jgi:hypothetical protein
MLEQIAVQFSCAYSVIAAETPAPPNRRNPQRPGPPPRSQSVVRKPGIVERWGSTSDVNPPKRANGGCCSHRPRYRTLSSMFCVSNSPIFVGYYHIVNPESRNFSSLRCPAEVAGHLGNGPWERAVEWWYPTRARCNMRCSGLQPYVHHMQNKHSSCRRARLGNGRAPQQG